MVTATGAEPKGVISRGPPWVIRRTVHPRRVCAYEEAGKPGRNQLPAGPETAYR